MNPTIETYNKGAEQFIEKYDTNAHHTEDLRRKFAELLSGACVLDVGSGSGSHARWFRERGLEVTCLDASRKLLENCQAQGFDILLQDYHHLDLPAEMFDGVYAANSLLHAKRSAIGEIFANLAASLKPGGIIGLSVKAGEGEEEIDGREFTYFTLPELEEALQPVFTTTYTEQREWSGTKFIWIIAQKA